MIAGHALIGKGDFCLSVLWYSTLRGEPAPRSSLQPMTPAALDRVGKRCLVKEKHKPPTSHVCVAHPQGEEVRLTLQGGWIYALPVMGGFDIGDIRESD